MKAKGRVLKGRDIKRNTDGAPLVCQCRAKIMDQDYTLPLIIKQCGLCGQATEMFSLLQEFAGLLYSGPLRDIQDKRVSDLSYRVGLCLGKIAKAQRGRP